MNTTQRPMNLATRAFPAHRRQGPPLRILLTAVMVFLAATEPSHLYADDDLGPWTGTYDKNGTSKTPDHFGDGEVYKDSKGHYYIKFAKGGKVMSLEPGSVTSWGGDNKGNATQPNPAPGPQAQFDNGIKNFIVDEIARLTPLTPAVGTSFYALELSQSLQSLGNSAQLWGDKSPFISTNGLIGLDQGPNLLSVLGSSTADGLTPVLYQYNPEATGLAFSFASSLDITLTAGSTYVPPVQSTDYVITGAAVPEPGSLILYLGGVAGIGGWLVWKRRRRPKKVSGPVLVDTNRDAASKPAPQEPFTLFLAQDGTLTVAGVCGGGRSVAGSGV